MSDGAPGADDSGRWWLNPALARMAFGTRTRPPAALAAGRITVEMERVLRSGQLLDLDDPAQRAFGEYDLLELIGQGGMGVVYRARQRNLEREVAIKLLSAGEWANEALIETLRREARQAAILQHPNIIVVHDMGEHAGLIFYVMELVPGHSLSHRLASAGRLSPRLGATVLRAVAEAIDYAHRMGVLHLDLKPGNILVDERDEPRIADFGLARRIEQALDHVEVTGTPSYMAPEQARTDGPPLTTATDIWAIGAVMYETLTGQPPFDAGNPVDTLRDVLDGPLRRPSQLAPVPADLEAICLKCLQRDPAHRYAHARQVADDLGHFLAGRAVSVRPLSVPRRVGRWMRREAPLAITGSMMFASLLGGVALASLQWQRAERRAATLSAQLAGQTDAPATPATTRSVARAGPAGASQTAADVDARPVAIALAEDGSQLAIAYADRSVRWYDAATLAERGRLELPGTLPGTRVSTPRHPPATQSGVHAATASTAIYSADGRHVLRQAPDGRLELWQVAPRKRLSTPGPAAKADPAP